MEFFGFVLSKCAGILVRPETWLILWLSFSYCALLMQHYRLAKWILGVLLGAVLTLAIVPIGGLLVQPLEAHYPNNPELQQLEGIVILGGAEHPSRSVFWQQVQLNAAAERYTAALALAKRFPEARIVFSGGSGRLRDVIGDYTTEGAVAEAFFLEQGIAASRLYIETKARTTQENARYAWSLTQPKAQERWVLVTSAFHMPRALQAFEKAGWQHLTAYPVDYRSGALRDELAWNFANNLDTLNVAVKEYIALWWYSR